MKEQKEGRIKPPLGIRIISDIIIIIFSPITIFYLFGLFYDTFIATHTESALSHIYIPLHERIALFIIPPLILISAILMRINIRFANYIMGILLISIGAYFIFFVRGCFTNMDLIFFAPRIIFIATGILCLFAKVIFKKKQSKT